MADEVTVSCELKFQKGSVVPQIMSSYGLTFDVSGTKYTRKTQSIGTSQEVIDTGDIASGSEGYIMIKNNDATNYVSVRADSGLTDLIRIEAGEVALFRINPSATPYAIANTAACQIEYLLIED